MSGRKTVVERHARAISISFNRKRRSMKDEMFVLLFLHASNFNQVAGVRFHQFVSLRVY
jgi:hypothetical protein